MPCPAMRPPIPGPRLPAVTRLLSRCHELRSDGPEYIDKLHRQYGPIVQTGPKRVSVNDAAGVRDIYIKCRWLDRASPAFPYPHADNLIATVDGDLHHIRRQPLQAMFDASAVERARLQGAIAASVRRHLLSSVPSVACSGKEDDRDDAKDDAKYDAKEGDMEGDMEGTTGPTSAVRAILLEVMGVVVYGKEVAINDKELRNLRALPTHYFPDTVLGLRRAVDNADTDSLLYRLFAKFQSEGPSPTVPSEEYILAECLCHFWAGLYKTMSVIVPVLDQLSLPGNKGRQLRLRKELQACGIDFAKMAPTELSKRLESLTYLDAILRETMRVNPPVPIGLERQVSAREGSVSIHGHEIPLGWNVSSAPYSTHRNIQVFSHPDFYDPERWLVNRESVKSVEDLVLEEERLNAMERHFFAFGAGPRMCIGVDVAWSIMRQVIAGVYSRFETTVTKRWVDDKMVITFKRVR